MLRGSEARQTVPGGVSFFRCDSLYIRDRAAGQGRRTAEGVRTVRATAGQLRVLAVTGRRERDVPTLNRKNTSFSKSVVDVAFAFG